MLILNGKITKMIFYLQVDRRHVPPQMPTHVRQEVEALNASMRHQRMMYSQEFLDFHFNIINNNKCRIGNSTHNQAN